MWRGILFIGVLVVTAGVVAWVGDVVGYRLGKKRVSLFGIRPRTTALIIGILSGVLISVVTIAVLSLASDYVRQALFEQGRIQATISRLHEQQDELTAKVTHWQGESAHYRKAAKDARERAEAAQQQVERIQSELAKLQEQRRVQHSNLQRLTRAKGKLETAKTRLEASIKDLEAQIADAEAELFDAEQQLAAAQEMLELRQGRIQLRGEEFFRRRATKPIFRAEDELARRAIDTAQPTSAAETDLYALLDEASVVALAAGAAVGENGRGVRYSVSTGSAEEPSLWVEMPEHKAIAAAARELVDQTEKSMVVVAVSKYNALPGEQVGVTFEYQPNKLVFTKGEVVGRIVVDGGAKLSRIYTTLMVLLTKKAHQAAMDRDMLPQPNSDEYGAMSVEEVFDTIEQVKQRGRPVEVAAVVQQDTWTIGPLNLDLRIEEPGPPNADLSG